MDFGWSVTIMVNVLMAQVDASAIPAGMGMIVAEVSNLQIRVLPRCADHAVSQENAQCHHFTISNVLVMDHVIPLQACVNAMVFTLDQTARYVTTDL